MSAVGPGPRTLAIDTSTRASWVVLGDPALIAVSRREVRHRHGSNVLEQLEEVLAAASMRLEDVEALAVGTGPGSFTGLRVGLATAKTLAAVRALPLVGIGSTDVLRRAAEAAGAPPGAAVVLPAGAHDHYLARSGEGPVLVPPGDVGGAVEGLAVIGVDLPDDALDAEARRLGEAARDGLPEALLALAHERLAAGDRDDVAELVPAYVALPRGVARAPEELGWSPDLR